MTYENREPGSTRRCRAFWFQVPPKAHGSPIGFSQLAAGAGTTGSVLAGPDSTCPVAACAHGALQPSPSAGPAGRRVSPVCLLCSDPERPGLAPTGVGSSGPGRPPRRASRARERDGGTPAFARPVSSPLGCENHWHEVSLFPGCFTSVQTGGTLLTILRSIRGRSFCLVSLVPVRPSARTESRCALLCLCQIPASAPRTSGSDCFVFFKRDRWTRRSKPGASMALRVPSHRGFRRRAGRAGGDARCLPRARTDDLSPDQIHLLLSLFRFSVLPRHGCLCGDVRSAHPDRALSLCHCVSLPVTVSAGRPCAVIPALDTEMGMALPRGRPGREWPRGSRRVEARPENWPFFLLR